MQAIVLPLPYRVVFIYIEPILTILAAYSAFTSPEWYLSSLVPGPTVTGLLHTKETNMAMNLYSVVLLLLAMISLSVLPAIAKKFDPLSLSIARRLMFALLGISVHLVYLLTEVADVLHIYVTCIHLGERVVKDVANWNDMTWGNIGITIVLFLFRVSWFRTVGIKSSSNESSKTH